MPMPHLSASSRALWWRLRSTLRRLRVATVVLPLLAAAATASCGGGGDGPSAPSTGSLHLTVTGLPTGTTARISVTGPGQFSRQVAGEETLDGLVPGSYLFTASDVTTDAEIYAARQPKGTVTVAAGSTPAAASVEYAPASGALAVTIQGLPDGTSADVTVTSTDGSFSQKITATTTLARLRAGTYVVTVGSVSNGSTLYFVAGTPQAQTVTVAVGETAAATVPYGAVTGLNLTVAGLYVVQTVQRLDQSIPLVQGRDGLVRVFVRAAQDQTPAPAVRVRFYLNGQLSTEQTIAAPMQYAPTFAADVAQASLASSWNVAIPAALVQPGLSISADVDPGNVVPEIDESDNSYPGVGQQLSANVRTVPAFRVRFVPIYQSANGLVGDVTAANRDRFLATTRKLHPLNTIDADIRAPYTATVEQLSSSNSDSTWTRVLHEVDVARDLDCRSDPVGCSRYYYGVAKVTYSSGTAGLGYVGYPVAMGWDYLPSASEVMAHELGHNWGRFHAPCGVDNPDLRYPYAGGKIGVYGYDATTGQLKLPSAPDVMGYCNGTWISDYTYTGIMNFRASASASVGSASDGATADATETAAAQAPVQRCLLVWGRVVDGRPVLEPAFEVMARPSLPQAAGPLTLAATSAGGATLWSLSFAGREIADAPRGDRTFAFTIPVAQAHADEIAALRLAAPSGEATVRTTEARGSVPAVRATRTTSRPRWVRLRWDAARHPVAMVRDARSGAILSFARGGDAEVRTAGDGTDAVDVILSDRVRSVSRRVPVERQ